MNAPIKRHRAIIGLSRDHHTGLLIAMVIKKDSPKYKGMPEKPEDKIAFVQAQFVTHLNPHFEKEENILFPFVRGRTPHMDELIVELIKEHDELEQMLGTLHSFKDPETGLDKFGTLLESHIRKEERQLFQEIQENFSEEELDELGKLLGE